MIKITNDTNTLNGSLLEMKDQLISELANQGVTATYDPSTGLLGLIHKISEITPSTQTLTLTSNKSILSQADSETATLTAVHSGGAGKTVEIYNASSGAKIGDATDNSDGTYTYIYNARGYGDISMTAVSGVLESNAITIEDCYYASNLQDSSNWLAPDGTPTYLTGGGIQMEGNKRYILNIQLPSEYTVEFGILKYSSSNRYNLRISWYDATSISYDDSYSITHDNTNHNFWGIFGDAYNTTINDGDIGYIQFKTNDNFFKWNNDILSTNLEKSISGRRIGFKSDSNIKQKITYLKVKPL